MKKLAALKHEDPKKLEAACFFCSATGWIFDGHIAALCRACQGDGTMKMPKTVLKRPKRKEKDLDAGAKSEGASLSRRLRTT